jgi:hypothetical protein
LTTIVCSEEKKLCGHKGALEPNTKSKEDLDDTKNFHMDTQVENRENQSTYKDVLRPDDLSHSNRETAFIKP